MLVSHFHADHYGGLPLLILDGQFTKRTRPLVIAGPPGIRDRVAAQMEAAFPTMSRSTQRFPIGYVELGSDPRAIGPFGARAVPVVHTPGSEPRALRIEAHGLAVAYSGDTEWTPALVEIAADADVFVTESYSFEKAIPFHLSYRTLMSHRDELRARRIVLTHFGADALEHLDAIELERASDGLRIGL